MSFSISWQLTGLPSQRTYVGIGCSYLIPDLTDSLVRSKYIRWVATNNWGFPKSWGYPQFSSILGFSSKWTLQRAWGSSMTMEIPREFTVTWYWYQNSDMRPSMLLFRAKGQQQSTTIYSHFSASLNYIIPEYSGHVLIQSIARPSARCCGKN